MQRKIFKTGHSAAITLSQNILESLGLKVGDNVKIEFNKEKGEVVIRHGNKASQLPLDLKIRPRL